VSVDIYSVIVTILYTMRLQLDAHDNICIKCKYGKETLSHFTILDGSNLVGNTKPAYLMPLHWPMPALLTRVPTEIWQARTTASKAARRRMPPLLTPTNPTPRRALVQPQALSLISAPFPQSSISALGNGGTTLQCPAKHRVLLCTAAEQVEEDQRPLHDPLLD